ncbi:ATP-dependent DNA ligase [Candidatus Parvarchaeota archaeon]|nr:ATP-dependent DNA ligase [Candidatus Acidifodinimicrobium mancum]
MKFYELSECFRKLEATTKRLEMFDILSETLSKVSKEEIAKTVYMLQETLLPPFFNVQLGIADKMAEKAMAEAYGITVERIEKAYKEKGDLGNIAEELNDRNKGSTLTVSQVYDKLMEIAQTSGEGSVDKKVKLISELLKEASGLEAKYTVRFMLGKLRLGVGEATIMEALSMAKLHNRDFKGELERAFNLCSNLGEVAEVFYKEGEKGVRNFKIETMEPIRPALAERLPNAEEIIKKLGRCAVDQKFDGFRAQVHKDGDKVKVYSRNLEDITGYMPEITEAVKKLKVKKIIFDSEALTYDDETNTLYPFQITIQRKRKHNVEEASQNFPLRLFVFDIMLLDDTQLINEPYSKRRETLEKLFQKEGVISKSSIIVTDDPKEFDKFFEITIGNGLEGVVAKKLDAPYAAGARNFSWVKLKRSYKSQLNDTIDTVILGYFKGKGLRAELGIGALLVGVYDEKADMFRTIAKVGSGFSEEQFKELRRMLDDEKVDKKPARVDSILVPDVWVEPKYVIAVKADEITKSPIHTCGAKEGVGYALRFPRAVTFIRTDKKAEDTNSVKEIEEMFEEQRRVKV